MKKIGVLGTGTMGAGIIQVLAQNGYEVVLRARRQTSVDNGIATVTKNLDKMVKKETRAVEYLNNSSIKYRKRNKNLISSHTTHYTRVQSSSSGGGGGFSSHSGSSGGGHGGGSGRHG